MTLSLIIAEKPSQAQAYVNALGNFQKHEGYFEIKKHRLFPNGVYVTYGFGHLVTLKEPHEYEGFENLKKWTLNTLPIVPERFEFKVSDDKRKQFNVVKKLLQKCSEIIIATDCDREGENIARLIIRQAKAENKPTKRLWINSLEDDEILKGFQNLKNGADYLPFAEEAQARQISDWLVGLNMSRLYTLLLAQKGVKGPEGKSMHFSVGRVQTPTLCLIYKRQQEITNFKPQAFYELESTFKVDTGSFKAKYKGKYDQPQEIEDLLAKHGLSLSKHLTIIKDVNKTVKKTFSPTLFSLSSLQILANKKYKYSPSQVLSIVQSLYDNPLKLVTYPRTDTPYITENEFSYLKETFSEYQALIDCPFEPYTLEPQKRYVDNKKVQEHYAIVPTKKIPSKNVLDKLSDEQKNIYFEIVRSVLGMFHKPYLYEETVIHVDLKGLLFETKGKTEVDKGWKELFPEVINEESETSEIDETLLLPAVSPGMSCEANLSLKEGKTTKPKHYTEGDLIPLMRDCGKSKELDEASRTILKEVEGLGTEATRSGIIETLKKQNYIEIKKNKVFVTPKGELLCKVVNGTLLSKPELTAQWENYLYKIGHGQGKKELFIDNTIKFTKTTIESILKRLEGVNLTPSIHAVQSEAYIALCPSCKKGYIVEQSKFYGCSEYKNGCKLILPKTILSKNLTKNQIKQLCEKGKTTKIKGFKKKDSEVTFDAYLKFEDGKIQFLFK